MKKNIIGLLSIAILSGFVTACKPDYLNTQPTTSLSDKTLSETEAGLTGVINGIHNMFYQYVFAQSFGAGAMSVGTQLDFLGETSVNSKVGYHMSVHRWITHRNPNGSINYYVWDYNYTIIQHCNTFLKMTKDGGNMDPKRLQALRGEAKVVRAHCYNILTALFGQRYVAGGDNSSLGVVLRLEPTIVPMKRSSVKECYAQIVKDVEEGISDLEKGEASTAKNRINIPTAYGIAARIYLGLQDYAKAEAYAAKAIASFKGRLQTGAELLDGFNNVNAAEWMWGYAQAGDQSLGYASWGATYSSNFVNGWQDALRFAINRSYYDKMGKNDVRRKWFVALDQGDKIPADADKTYFGTDKLGNPSWETTGQCIKFRSKGTTSNIDNVLMRLGEMYYIKAEAQARQGKVAEAAATLNTVMKSRDPEYVANASLSADELAKEILRNKRIDMYFEGQEFFDIKRLGIVPNRLGSGNDKYMNDAEKALFIKRNTGEYAETMPKDANDKVWQFVIPYDEIVGNKLCEQNPL